MPILKAALKSMKVSKKKAARNQSIKSRLKKDTKKFIDFVSSKKMDEAKTQLKKLISLLDKATSKGVIHRNTGSRKKSRLSKKIK